MQRCFDRKHIDEKIFLELNTKAQVIIDQISKFMNYLKASDKKGSKYDGLKINGMLDIKQLEE